MLGVPSRQRSRLLFWLANCLSILIVGVISVLLLASQTFAAPGINQQLTFQGRLFNTQGAAVPDGYYNIEFKIYEGGSGSTIGNPDGTLKWTESRLNSAGHGVLVKNGYMAVELGSVVPFGGSIDWNQDTIWLSMNIGSTNSTCTPLANSCSIICATAFSTAKASPSVTVHRSCIILQSSLAPILLECANTG